MRFCFESYVEETGSTWYVPSLEELGYFNYQVSRGYMVKEGKYYTTKKLKEQEEKIAKYVVARVNFKNNEIISKEAVSLFVALYEQKENIKLDEWQKEAVYQAVVNNLFVLTGGPGTGKTTVLKAILYCLQNILEKNKIVFCSPTGKAARRITESTGCPASTVAKLLGLKDEDDYENVERLNLLDCVIVDEVSMLDTKTSVALFSSIALKTKLILVGDVEQLPSVGYGSILRDLLDANVPQVRLEKTFRQASESGLFANIEAVKAGLPAGFIKRNDFEVFDTESTETAKRMMVEEYQKAIKEFGKEQVVCLTPYRRKGEACSIQINKILQKKCNSGKKGITVPKKEEDGFEYEETFREGDPVMQLVNTNTVANGDVGIITEVNTEKMYVCIDFNGLLLKYGRDRLNELTLAYAMTVHKSQGSEYSCVITSTLDTDYEMLSRNTIYTAIARAKKKCVIIQSPTVPQKACEKEIGYERTTKVTKKIWWQQSRLNLLKQL